MSSVSLECQPEGLLRSPRVPLTCLQTVFGGVAHRDREREMKAKGVSSRSGRTPSQRWRQWKISVFNVGRKSSFNVTSPILLTPSFL